MSDNEAAVRITADASGVQPGVDLTKEQIADIGPVLAQLTTGFQELASQIRASMVQGAEATGEMASEMRALEAETEREELSLRSMAAGVHEAVEGFASFKAGLSEIAEVWLAAFAVERITEWSKSMGEAAEKVVHLSQTFGMTTDQVQQFQGVAAATGIPVDALVRSMTVLDKNLANSANSNGAAANAFKQLGISIDDGRSHWEKLYVIADKFKDMDDGPKKVALSMEALGRSGAALIPILNLGAEGLKEIQAKTAEYGVENSDAVEKGSKLAEQWNENRLAMMGLANTMTEAFAPAMATTVEGVNQLIAAMVKSYQAGGQMRTILDAIGAGCRAVLSMLIAVGAAVDWLAKTIDGALWGIAGVLNGLSNAVAASIDICVQSFRLFGAVAYDALTMRWSSIESDWKTGLGRVADAAREGGKHVADSFREGFAQGGKEWGSADKDWSNADAFVKRLNSGSAPKGGQESGKGGGDFDPALGKTPKQKGDQPSIVEQWKAQLAEALTEEKNWGADEAAYTLQFWQEKLAQTKAGSKEEVEVRREVAKAKMAVFKEEQQDELSSIKNTLAAKTDLAKTDIDLAKIGLQNKLQAIDEEEKAGQISASKAAAMRADVNRQLYQLDLDLENREFQLKLAAYNDELKLEHLKPAQRAEINREIELLQQQHVDRMQVISAQNDQKMVKDSDATADAIRNKWQSIAQPMVSAMGTAISGIISKTQTLRQAWQSIGQALLQEVMQWAEKQVVVWVGAEAAKTGATQAGAAIRTGTEAAAATTTTGISAITALKQIAHSAAVAAARVYASIAQIPIVGPFLAPAMAAAAIVGVIKLGQMVFSAQDGMGDVPYDNAPFLLHKNEMVLPASLATPLRSMLQSGGGGANLNAPAPANDGGGDTHYHFTFPGQVVTSPGDLQRWAKANAAPLASGLHPHIKKWYSN